MVELLTSGLAYVESKFKEVFPSHLGLGCSVSHLLGLTNAGIYREMDVGLQEIYRWIFSCDHLGRFPTEKSVAMCVTEISLQPTVQRLQFLKEVVSPVVDGIHGSFILRGAMFLLLAIPRIPLPGDSVVLPYHQGKFGIEKFWNSQLPIKCRRVGYWIEGPEYKLLEMPVMGRGVIVCL